MFSVTDTSSIPAAFQGVADRRVVVAVAGEPVDLVHDHVVEVSLLLDALQQRAQLGTVGGLRGLATVHVLTDDLRVQAGCLV